MEPKPKYRVFLLEDDDFIRNLYAAAFKNMAMDTEVASDAEGDFIERVVAFKPDLVSVDIALKQNQEGGFDAVRRLQTDERTKTIPLFFLTNFYDEKHEETAKGFKAVEYIVKANLTPKEVGQRFLNFLEGKGR